MKELFDRIDTDGSNNLDLQESILFFKSITDDISDENIEKIFNNLDTDGNKSIDFNEFMVRLYLNTVLFPFLSSGLVQHNLRGRVEPGSEDRKTSDPRG